MQKKQIQFNKSMTSDKRSETFAYLSKNVLNSQTEGLYPGRDYIEQTTTLTDDDSIVNIYQRNTATLVPLVITKNGTTYSFYPLGSNTKSNTDVSNIDAFGSDGESVFYVLNDGKVYSVNNSGTGHTLRGTLPDYTSGDVKGGFYDGLHVYWVGAKIYRILPSDNTIQLSFTQTGFTDICFVDFYENLMAVGVQRRDDSIVFLWDKKNTTLFASRKLIKNTYLLAGGVVDSVLQIVTSTASSENPKEQQGEIIISAFNNSSFQRINSIVAYGSFVKKPTVLSIGSHISVDSDNMLFSVVGNDTQKAIHPELSQNYIYKTLKNGSIEVIDIPKANGAINYASIVKIFRNFNLFVVNNTDDFPPVIYSNDYSNSDYNNYAGYSSTEYITDFYCDPGTLHSMHAFSFTFEKLFKNENIPAPVPGAEGVLSVFGVTKNTSEVAWSTASDDSTPKSQLQYAVYISTTNNIGTVDNAETNGTLVKFYTQNINEFVITGLTPETVYWVNVIVRNLAGKKAAYVQKTFTTTDSVVTEWKHPTNNGSVLNSSIDLPEWDNPANAYAEDGLFATAFDATPHQAYFNFNVDVPTGATVTGIEVQAKGFKSTSIPAGMSFQITKTAGAEGGKTEKTNGFDTETVSLTNFNEKLRVSTYSELWGTTFSDTEINGAGLGLIVNGSVSAPDTYTIEKLYQRELAYRYLNYGTMTKLSDTRFAMAMFNDDTNELQLRIFQINRSTGVISMGGAYSVLNSATPAYYPALATYDENKFILFYTGNSSRGYAQTFQTSGSTISAWGTQIEFNSASAHSSCVQVDSNHFLNVWEGGGTWRVAQVFEIDTSNGNITAMGSPITLVGTTVFRNSVTKINSTKYLVARAGDATDAFATLLTVDTSTWQLTVSTNVEYKDGVTNYGNDVTIVRQSPVTAVNIYASDSGLNLIDLNVNLGTSAVTLGTLDKNIGIKSYGSADERSNRLIHRIDDDHILVFHRNSSGFAYASTFSIDWGTSVATLIDEVSLIDSPTSPDDFFNYGCSVDMGDGLYVVAWVDEVNGITSFMQSIRVAPTDIPYYLDDIKIRVFYEE